MEIFEAFDLTGTAWSAAQLTGSTASTTRSCGGIIKQLPPHVEPPAELEDRTVGAMVTALAGQSAEPEPRSDAEDQGATRAYPIPSSSPRLSP